MQLFRTNCFTFLTEVRMPQVRKSCSCGIFAIFLQCYFMIETQALMTASDFSGVFSRNHFLEGGFTFLWGLFFRWRGLHFIFKRGHWGGHRFRWEGGGGSKKIVGWRGRPSPMPPQTMGNPSNMDVDVLNPRNIAQVHMAGLYKLKHNLC